MRTGFRARGHSFASTTGNWPMADGNFCRRSAGIASLEAAASQTRTAPAAASAIGSIQGLAVGSERHPPLRIAPLGRLPARRQPAAPIHHDSYTYITIVML
jgi:hypothetical protein